MIEAEKPTLTQYEIDIRERSIHKLKEAQLDRITKGKVNVAKGMITVIALEMLAQAITKDVTVILPNDVFAKKFSSALGVCLNIMKVPAKRLDPSTLWLWDRSRLMLTNPTYYTLNKKQFWGSKVEEIRL